MIGGVIWIPYHDSMDFLRGRIVTREYALMHVLNDCGIDVAAIVDKPRTLLDRRRHDAWLGRPSEQTVEGQLASLVRQSHVVRPFRALSIEQVTNRRGWWVSGYMAGAAELRRVAWPVHRKLVYSNNPFAYRLLDEFKRAEATVVFDCMDNFALHPSLVPRERTIAKHGYEVAAGIADFMCANSVETRDFIQHEFGRTPELVKNGVFSDGVLPEAHELHASVVAVCEKRGRFPRMVGYLGKIGARLDVSLIEAVANVCTDTLFVFAGPTLSAQQSSAFERLCRSCENVMRVGAIPHEFVGQYLECFDVLMIPHKVGQGENGGDPLKLYEYLRAAKPVVTTGIAGVEEFRHIVRIANDAPSWIEYLRGVDLHGSPGYTLPEEVLWTTRAAPLVDFVAGLAKKRM